MNKSFCIIFLLLLSVFLTGSGYKGTLPDLDAILQTLPPPEKNEVKNEILPLDKLTLPIQKPVKIDKTLVEYNYEMQDVIRQLERLEEILNNDKSFKNFIAAANMLDLTAQNIVSKFREPRFQKTNKILSDVSYDTLQIKAYWIQITKNAPYVLNYETNGAYSGEELNKQLNRFAKVLSYAKRELKSDMEKIK